MSTQEEAKELQEYISPKLELWTLSPKLNLLEYASLEGDVEDFIDGEDL